LLHPFYSGEINQIQSYCISDEIYSNIVYDFLRLLLFMVIYVNNSNFGFGHQNYISLQSFPKSIINRNSWVFSFLQIPIRLTLKVPFSLCTNITTHLLTIETSKTTKNIC